MPIRLFYASDNTTFEEYLWFAQDDVWAWQRSWKGYSGTAGVACDHQGDPFYRYVGMVNLQNQLEFWYQVKGDDDLSAEWLKCKCDHIKALAGDTDVFFTASNSVDNVHPASSLSFFKQVAVWQEHLTGRIKVYLMIWEGEGTKPTTDYSPDIAYKGLLGTRIDAMAVAKELVYVFYQRDGEDVARLARNLDIDKAWTPIMLPV